MERAWPVINDLQMTRRSEFSGSLGEINNSCCEINKFPEIFQGDQRLYFLLPGLQGAEEAQRVRTEDGGEPTWGCLLSFCLAALQAGGGGESRCPRRLTRWGLWTRLWKGRKETGKEGGKGGREEEGTQEGQRKARDGAEINKRGNTQKLGREREGERRKE